MGLRYMDDDDLWMFFQFSAGVTGWVRSGKVNWNLGCLSTLLRWSMAFKMDNVQ